MTTALMTKNSVLTAKTTPINGGSGTNVFIYADGQPVASATLGGRWQPAHAIAEFRKAAHRFKDEGYLSLALALGLGVANPPRPKK